MRLYQLEDWSTSFKHTRIFGKKMKGVEVCTNRFDDDTKNSFIELYTKVDGGASAEQIAEQQRQSDISIHKWMTMIVSRMRISNLI